jgi:hypothetical protein
MNVRLLLLVAALVSTGQLRGQIVYLEIRGFVESSSTATFAVSRPYSFTFSFDLSTPPTLVLAESARFDHSALAVVFNYDSGSYVGTASGLSIWTQKSSAGDGFALGFPAAGPVNFSAVDGHSISTDAGTPLLDLFDPTGTALSSTSLSNLAAGGPQFISGGDDRLRLRWGTGVEGIVLVATVDSIETANFTAVPEPGVYAAVGGIVALLAALLCRRNF